MPVALIEQVWFGPALRAAAASTAYWSLLFWRLRKAHSGQERLAESLRGKRASPAGPAPSSAPAAT